MCSKYIFQIEHLVTKAPPLVKSIRFADNQLKKVLMCQIKFIRTIGMGIGKVNGNKKLFIKCLLFIPHECFILLIVFLQISIVTNNNF